MTSVCWQYRLEIAGGTLHLHQQAGRSPGRQWMVVPSQILKLVWMGWEHVLAHLTEREREVAYRLQARLAVAPVQIPVVDAVRPENWREMYADFVT